jgi:hypothetical protein
MSIRAVPGGTDPLGANVVAGYEDGSVIGWDLRNRAILWRSKLFDEPAVAVAVGLSKSGGCRVVAGGAGDTLHIGKLPTRAADSGAGEGNPVSQLRDLKTIQLKHAGINSISIRDDGKLFARLMVGSFWQLGQKTRASVCGRYINRESNQHFKGVCPSVPDQSDCPRQSYTIKNPDYCNIICSCTMLSLSSSLRRTLSVLILLQIAGKLLCVVPCVRRCEHVMADTVRSTALSAKHLS